MKRELIEAYVTASTTRELKEAEAGLMLNDKTFFNTNNIKFKTLDNVRFVPTFSSYIKKGFLIFDNGFSAKVSKLTYVGADALFMLDICVDFYNVGSSILGYGDITGSKDEIDKTLVSIQLLEGPSIRDRINSINAKIRANSIYGMFGQSYSNEMKTLLKDLYVKALPEVWDNVNAEYLYPKSALTSEQYATLELSKESSRMYPNHITAPWKDYEGNDIFKGDTVQHPNGDRGVVIYELYDKDDEHRNWKVRYTDGEILSLFLQIGDRGRAVVVKD